MARKSFSRNIRKYLYLVQTVCWVAALLILMLNGSTSLSAQAATSMATGPAAPTDLRAVKGGPAPTLTGIQRYINPAFLQSHNTEPFDSSGGDLLVMYASSHNQVRFTPSDNFGNTWISISGPTSTTAEFDLRSEIWYAVHPKVGPNHIVTMHLSTGQALVMSIFVVKGANLYSPIDSVSLIESDNRTKSERVFSPQIDTTDANDLLLAWSKVADGAQFASGYGFRQQTGASSGYLDAESGTSSEPGSYKAGFLLNKPQSWQSAIVAIDGSQERATLTWKGGGDADRSAGVQYLIERCQGNACNHFAQIGVTRELSYGDTQLAPSAIYRYRVRAKNADGHFSPYSAVVSLTSPSIAPSVPGNLAASIVGLSKVGLSWTPASDDGAIERYIVERCTGADCTNFTPIASVTGTSYQDAGRLPWFVYKYRVQAVDDSDNIGPGVSLALRTVALSHRRELALMLFLLVLLCCSVLVKARHTSKRQFGSPQRVRFAAGESEQFQL